MAGTYTLSFQEKIVGGDIEARSDLVVRRNGGQLSGDVIHGFIDRRGLSGGMEVVKECAAEANLLCAGTYNDLGVEREGVWLFAVEYSAVGTGHQAADV